MFRMCGNRVEILRYKIDYTENEEQFTAYAATEEEADEIAKRYNGVKSALVPSDDEWIDGLEVADVSDTYAEAMRIYELGKEGYEQYLKDQEKRNPANLVKQDESLNEQVTQAQVALTELFEMVVMQQTV